MTSNKFGTDRRKRYLDKYQVGPSIFWDEKELVRMPWRARHAFRHRHALGKIDRLKGLAAFYNFEFTINPDLPNMHHFQFHDPLLNAVYHWYPSSAKFVIEPMWKQGIHIFDFLQVFNFIMLMREENANKDPSSLLRLNLKGK